MPDLVQNHSVAAKRSSSSLTSTADQYAPGRSGVQYSISSIGRENYRGHPIDHLIHQPNEHYSDVIRRPHLDMANPYAPDDARHPIPGTN